MNETLNLNYVSKYISKPHKEQILLLLITEHYRISVLDLNETIGETELDIITSLISDNPCDLWSVIMNAIDRVAISFTENDQYNIDLIYSAIKSSILK